MKKMLIEMAIGAWTSIGKSPTWSWFAAWPGWLLAVLAGAVVAAVVVLWVRPFADERRALRSAPYWMVGGSFAWVFWVLLAEDILGKGIEQPGTYAALIWGITGVASALFIAGGVVTWYRETLEAAARGRMLSANWLRVPMLLSLAFFSFVSLWAGSAWSLGGSFYPDDWLWMAWIGSGLGPFLVITLLERRLEPHRP